MIQFLGSPPFDSSRAGKKASNLHELLVAGFSVPAGFVISRFDSVAEEYESDDELAKAVEAIGGYPVAVRSSGCFEDLEGASFAGQYESFLNVFNLKDLKEKIDLVQASSRSERAEHYLSSANLKGDASVLSVLVQKMVSPFVAGVAFSINPLSGRENEALIEYCDGLGDKLVSGQVKPSQCVIGLETGQVCDSDILSPDSTHLSPLVAHEMAETLLKIQAHFGCPQDVEWALTSQGKLWILQSRPITKIYWRKDCDEHTTANMKEGGISSKICYPLVFSLIQSAFQKSMDEYLGGLKLIPKSAGKQLPIQWMSRFYGKAYWNAGAVKRSLFKIPGFSEKSFDADLGINKQYDPKGPHQTPVNLKTVLRAIPVAIGLEKAYRSQEKKIAEFKKYFEQEEKRLFTQVENFKQTEDAEFYGMFKKLISEFFHRTECTYLMAGYNNANAQSDFNSLVRKLTEKSGQQISTLKLISGLSEISHLKIQKELDQLCSLARQQGFESEEWKKELNRFLNKNYYHGDSELDISVPRWKDEPWRVKQTIEKMIETRVQSIDLNRSRQNKSAEYEAELCFALGLVGKSFISKIFVHRHFLKKLTRLRNFLAVKEEMRTYSSRSYYFVRQFVLEAGKRMAAQGIILESSDIFYYSISNLLQFIESGFSDLKLKNHAHYEKLMYLGYRGCKAPDEIGRGVAEKETISWDDSSDVLTGVGCSTGIVEGRVRVLLSLSQLHEIREGEILVTRFTDPSWTPALGRVKGVITEVGGVLSHAAIVGREYGIPAVLNLQGATERLSTGQWIQMNGATGTVQVKDQLAH